MKWTGPHRFFVAVLLAGLAFTSCTAGRLSHPDSDGDLAVKVQARIKPLVETLYLKTKDLEAAYLDLRTIANAQAFLPDDLQLSYIQKTALYVQLALLSASHQWEFLSIMEDIKPSAAQDYYTLRHKSLRQALDETGYDLRFLKLYQAYITNTEVQKEILGALDIIEEVRKLFGQLLEAISPLVRQGLPTAV